ncbi:MAG: DUF2339 domain-containing protein [Epulopiscium sp.]|nr:DUF2339 domain-containing protein [Candidatus Epulonipiscium sp.]
MDDKTIILERLNVIEKRLARLEHEFYNAKTIHEKPNIGPNSAKTTKPVPHVPPVPPASAVPPKSHVPSAPGVPPKSHVPSASGVPPKSHVPPVSAVPTKPHTTPMTSGGSKPSVPPAPPQKMPQKPKNFKKEVQNFEMELGGKWINRIGIIALILGSAFFLKYSFENNLIGPQVRILIGVILGIAMLVFGDMQFKKYRIPAEGLMGGGIAVLCFTVYAAFSFYSFIGQNTAFILFILIVGVCTFLAIRNDTVTIMHLGVLTGFLAPFLVSGGESNDVFFFTYLVILNLGIMTISYYKSWKSLFYVAFFASHFCFSLWFLGTFFAFNAKVDSIQFFTGFIPMTIIFFEFLVVSILMNISSKNKKPYLKFDTFLIFMNAMVYYGEGYGMLSIFNDSLLGIFTIMIAIVFLGIYFGLKEYQEVNKGFLTSLLLAALLFITIAIPVQLEGRFLSLAWAVEGLMLSYLSTQAEFKKINFAYIGVVGIALISLSVDLIHIGEELHRTPFININSITYVLSIIALFGVLWIKREESSINLILTVVLNLLLLVFFLTDTSNIIDRLIESARNAGQFDSIDNYMYMRDLLQSLVILLYSIVLIVIGIIKNSKKIRIFSLSLFLLVIFKVFLNDLASLEGIYRILSFMALGVILIGISFIYQKYKNLILGENLGETKKDI